jgi:nicotinate-nucleotide adenylyltransferase
VTAAPGRRLGVFGGTFDPIHIGHLVTAVSVHHDLGLDRLLLVVAHDPWQKTGAGEQVTPSDVRFAMVSAAVSDVPGLEASDIELRRPGPTYTADTLRQLHEQEPDAELFLIVGSDAAGGLPTWERADEVRDLATLVVMPRPNHEEEAPPEGWKHVEVDVPSIELSSTDVRERVAAGRPIHFLVPDPVRHLIEERALYCPRR